MTHRAEARVTASMKGAPLWLRGLSTRGYLANLDPVSGTVYHVMLGIFAVMLLLVARKIE
jgi:hypothetical protein